MNHPSIIPINLVSRLADVSLEAAGIVSIRFRYDEYEVNIRDVIEMSDLLNTIAARYNNYFPLLVVSGRYGTVSNEARDMNIYMGGDKNYPAVGIVIHGLAHRIMANFYFRLNGKFKDVPYKLFSTETDARTWLMNYRILL